MVSQVKIVGILMLVHGITVTLMGALYAAVGPMVMAFAPPPPAGGGGPPPELLLVIYVVMGSVIMVVGVINIIAGYRVMTMRNRVLGIVALFLNILPMLTCYCAPTSIGMMIYGLIVLFQGDVGLAFERVSRGATPAEAVRYFSGRFGDARDDYDDMGEIHRSWDDDRRRGRGGEGEDRLDDDDDRERR